MSATNTNQKIKAYVICTGVLYGNGEQAFYEYFKV